MTKLILRSVLFFLFISFSLLVHAESEWQPVLKLIEEQKFKQATTDLDKLLKKEKQAQHNENWRQALILGAVLRSRHLGNNEAAANFLMRQSWPRDEESTIILNLHLAKVLSGYVNYNRWEIQNREKIASSKKPEIKKKTMHQLNTDINLAFNRAYQLAITRKDKSLNAFKLSSLKVERNYFTKPDYPPQVRGSIVDTVTYLWVGYLKDQSLWSPGHSNGTAELLLDQLLSSRFQVNPADDSIHPVKRISSLLGKLEQYELQQKKPEAALEAFRVKIETLASSHRTGKDLKILIKALGNKIENSSKDYPWLNMLRNSQAELMVQTNSPDANIKGIAVLNKCLSQHKKERVTQFCKQQFDQIKKPTLDLSAMKVDGLNKRSILLEHSNTDKVYLRAWRINLKHALSVNQHQSFEKLIRSGRKSDIEWQLKLNKGKDYRSHKTYITPPITQYGYWLIAASLKPDFSIEDKQNVLVSTAMSLSRFVVDTNVSTKQLNVTVYNGENGHIAPGMNVQLWDANYNNTPKFISASLTGKDGRTSFTLNERTNSKLVVKKGDDFSILDRIHPGYENGKGTVKSALIFTDRAVYRPGQKILWKIVAYKGDRNTGRYIVSPQTSGSVSLNDANGKLVKTIKIKTNQYGSASGEFTAKSGLLLGSWTISSSWKNSKSIRVEEYKRPTFKAKISPAKDSLYINETANITGKATYYFGGAVTDGKVKWQVKRMAIYPWNFGYNGNTVEELSIASGNAKLDEKGEFHIKFKPKAHVFTGDKPKKELTYQFAVSAEITDSGGETRDVSRTFSIGKSGIKASILQNQTYALTGKPFQLDINRQDMDGTPRAGNGNWVLYKIEQPKTPPLPADAAIKIKKELLPYASEGDRQSPRWSSSMSNDALVKEWKDGQKVSQGSVKHDDSGDAQISLKSLHSGLYRLRYTTQDEKGNEFKTQISFIVADKKQSNILFPAVLKIKDGSVEVGSNATLLLGSGFKGAPYILEVYHGNKLLKRYIQRGGVKQLEFPVKKEHRGGLNFVLTVLKDYQLIRREGLVSVPWTDRNLKVSFSTFRNKLQPGQKGTWRISVNDSKNRPMEKGAVEVLASMYDRSLDLISQHYPADVQNLYTAKSFYLQRRSSLGQQYSVYNKGYQTVSRAEMFYTAQLDDLLYLSDDPANEFSHRHPAIPRCTKAIRHTHHFKTKNHTHRYSCQSGGRGAVFNMFDSDSQVEGAAPVMAAPRSRAAKPQVVDVFALQRKLKAHGYYAGPIDGTVKPGTRAALQRFMRRGEGDVSAGEAIADTTDDLASIKTRTNFNETAFFYPHLVLEENGSVAFEFEVPESLTQWKVWVSAITKDLRGGSASEFATTSKELMVRPYLPRFLRAGDHAEIKVLVNNTGDKALTGKLDFDVLDPETEKSIASRFKLDNKLRQFTVEAGQSSDLRFSIIAPKDLGVIAIRARASASNGKSKFGDGEQRPLPVLPSRFHLSQSRFAALKANTSKQLEFKQLAQSNDTTRINENLVVTIDGQLFYSTLNALPYLTEYPYECTEQTMNRFLSTSIINSVFSKHPALASMAKKMKQRDSQYEQWDAVDKDPNRKMLLEETPWLNQAKGGSKDMDKLFNILDPKIAKGQHQKALQKLRKAQTSKGGFPWWEGGPDSPYMTAYLLRGFSRALEFKVDIPKDMVQKAWKYLHKHYQENLSERREASVNDITLTNYVLSSYPDKSWTGNVFSDKESAEMLDISFGSWKTLSPLLKAYLSLTLHRAGEAEKAKLIFDSIMDAATTDEELGTYWTKQKRSWLWYNDRLETHAFMLRTMMELNPEDQRRHGLVQWLMLNKKLNHWKSTRATAESIYSLVHYLQKDGQMGKDEKAVIKIGKQLEKTLLFKANEYTGANNQLLVKAEDIKPEMANISIANQSKSLMFASASWHFSTDKLPKESQGDFFKVDRKFFKRVQKGTDWELQPLAEGASIEVGDQLEVQLNLRAKHTAEYVHLRAPRGAGFEPEEQTSGYRWKNRAAYYEEIRDSGTNFFFERLPTGEYNFKYRLRATTAGQFRVAPATVQSIYAPEFNAYSSGKRLNIKASK